jgi:hypothetical protein
MTCDILIVSCEKHYPWLKWALRSMVKFASGFRQIMVAIPDTDMSGLNSWLAEFSNNQGVPIRFKMFQDWPDKGFLCHEWQITCADQFTDADFICHMDSDTLFCEPVSPADYFIDGKPVLMYATYHWLVTTQQANLGMWQIAVEKAIGGQSINEFMRRHPAVHPRAVYKQTRECIEKHTGRHAMEYIHSCDNAFPQGYCEFNTLGEVAWRHMHDSYRFWNQETEGFIKPHKVVQFWSHSSPEIAQSPYFRDKPFECTPESLLKIL